MKGVGPAVLEKPLEDDARFEQLPTAVTSEEFLDFSGSASFTAASLLYSVQYLGTVIVQWLFSLLTNADCRDATVVSESG